MNEWLATTEAWLGLALMAMSGVVMLEVLAALARLARLVWQGLGW